MLAVVFFISIGTDKLMSPVVVVDNVFYLWTSLQGLEGGSGLSTDNQWREFKFRIGYHKKAWRSFSGDSKLQEHFSWVGAVPFESVVCLADTGCYG